MGDSHTGDTYDPDREEVIGDAVFEKEDRRGIEALAFDIGEDLATSQPDEFDKSADFFLYDPTRKDLR